MRNLPISCWAAEDIPTNRAEKNGYDSLTNAELLSILIGSGNNRDMNAIELSRHILSLCGNNLNSLGRISEHDLLKISGMGKIKVARIFAAMELARRKNCEPIEEKPSFGTPTKIYNRFRFLEDNEIEEFWICLMNQNYRLVKEIRISQGGLTETSVDIRIIMRECVTNNATILACVHNHPSGNISPSLTDKQLTLKIKQACDIMRIHFQDHVIIGRGQYYSFHESGFI